MEIPAVQNLVNATLNPMGNMSHDASSLTAQSAEPTAGGGEAASDDSGFGSNQSGSQDNVGSHLNQKA